MILIEGFYQNFYSNEPNIVTTPGSNRAVTFWSTNQVYRLPANTSVMSCLQNGEKTKQKVVVEVNQDEKLIESCKFYTGF